MKLTFSNSGIETDVDIIPGKYKNFIDFLIKHNIKDLYLKEVQKTAPGYETIEKYLVNEKKSDQDFIAAIMIDDFTLVKWERTNSGINSAITIL